MTSEGEGSQKAAGPEKLESIKHAQRSKKEEGKVSVTEKSEDNPTPWITPEERKEDTRKSAILKARLS